MVNAIQTAISGLTAAAKRLETSSNNVANMSTVGSLEEGQQQPYEAQKVVQSSVSKGFSGTATVRAVSVPKDPAFVPSYDPDSPFADSEGNIGVPNVDMNEELVNMKAAEFAYKSNALVVETSKEMLEELQHAIDDEA